MPDISIDITEIENMIGHNLTANTTPTQDFVTDLITNTLAEVHGILQSRGMKIPIDTDESPNSAKQVRRKAIDYISAVTSRAHHAQLDDVPYSLYRDLRDREDRWEKYLTTLRSDKGILDDIVQLEDFNEVRSRGDFLAQPCNGPVFTTKDEF